MLSLASILNPEPPRQAAGSHFYSPPGSTSPEFPSFLGRSPLAVKRPVVENHNRMPKDHPGMSKSKVKGTVKFYPFEDLDEDSLREVRRFRVTPFEGIHTNCRHIPYNSGKKDFFEKTGRESFEVFQYTFNLPNDETEYAVMWDYNVGLVRMTPFFKCCNYPKTTPAKMLNMNPGLKDITHSITGGSIMAQGYWMPFSCAKAVCATFCHHISGALIPIFGPQFPSECVHPDAPDHGRMCIDPAIVAEATVEAEDFRRLYSEQASMAVPVTSPRQTQLQRRTNNNQQNRVHRAYNTCSPYQSRQQHLGGGRLPDSPYGTDTEEYDGYSCPEAGGDPDHLYHYHHPNHHYPYTTVPSYRAVHTQPPPPTSSGWTAANKQHHPPHSRYQIPSERHLSFLRGGPQASSRDQQQYDHSNNANPFLSALPRLAEQTPQSPSQPTRRYLPAVQPRHCNTPTAHHLLSAAAVQFGTNPVVAAPPTPVMSPKRPRGAAFESSTENTGDHGYDSGESHVGSSPTTSRAGRDGEGGEYRLHNRHHGHSRSDLQLPPIGVSVAATVAERNAALLLMNLSVAERHDGGDNKEDGENRESENKPAKEPVPWASFFKAARGGETTCQDEKPPAKKKRRTISI
ncbi:hypothetical protein GE09DRAFT_1283046 [Coniochaeta sp. 2T2.1]|nr:hypothetical protein GE09DRAFT_1283046 [Coniochaeta sp. 2T2.1]